MSVEGLEHYSKDQLIEELIKRETFVGLVIFHREDAKDGRLESGETVMTKSPPLTRQGVEVLLRTGESLVAGMFPADLQTEEVEQLSPVAESALRVDEQGVVRVGRSRITLDLIVDCYESGSTPEEIVSAYDTLVLADVYAAIGYYLRHQDEVRRYLVRRKEEADALQAKIEAEHPPISRQELLARKRAQEKLNAPAGE